jgi:hypothetical protein
MPLSFTIADIAFTLSWEQAIGGIELPPAFLPFQTSDNSDIQLDLAVEGQPCGEGALIFESRPIWSLIRCEGGLAFRIFETYPGLDRTLFIPEAGGRARPSFHGEERNPFTGPALELLTITHLARRGGAILHGCAVGRAGRGVVFAGESGAGKSTLARLWAKEPGVEIMSDDRAVIRRQGGSFRIYGTPWHGEAAFGSSGGAALDRIFFIRHGDRNQVRPLGKARSVQELLKASFPPLWDPAGMGAALELFEELAAAVPCAEMWFRPEPGVCEWIAI